MSTSTTYTPDPPTSEIPVPSSNEFTETSTLLHNHPLLQKFNSDLETEYTLRTKPKAGWFSCHSRSHKHEHKHKKKLSERYPNLSTALTAVAVAGLVATLGYSMYELSNTWGGGGGSTELDKDENCTCSNNNSTSKGASVNHDSQAAVDILEAMKKEYPEWNITYQATMGGSSKGRRDASSIEEAGRTVHKPWSRGQDQEVELWEARRTDEGEERSEVAMPFVA